MLTRRPALFLWSLLLGSTSLFSCAAPALDADLREWNTSLEADERPSDARVVGDREQALVNSTLPGSPDLDQADLNLAGSAGDRGQNLRPASVVGLGALLGAFDSNGARKSNQQAGWAKPNDVTWSAWMGQERARLQRSQRDYIDQPLLPFAVGRSTGRAGRVQAVIVRGSALGSADCDSLP